MHTSILRPWPIAAALAAALAISPLVTHAKPRSVDELFLPGSYTAVLQVRAQAWQLLDTAGAVTRIDVSDCGPRITLPAGLWLLTRDHAGTPKLVAPSATPLPLGHSGEIALAACGEARSTDTLQLPAALITALESHASTILVQH